MSSQKNAISRDIPRELAQIQRERGYALTRADFKALGYKDDQLSDSNIERAAEVYASEIERVAA